MAKKICLPRFSHQGRQHSGSDYFFFLAAGFLAAGFFAAFLVAIVFIFLFVSLNFGMVSFSEGDGIMLPST
jgi:hypothetical protein